MHCVIKCAIQIALLDRDRKPCGYPRPQITRSDWDAQEEHYKNWYSHDRHAYHACDDVEENVATGDGEDWDGFTVHDGDVGDAWDIDV